MCIRDRSCLGHGHPDVLAAMHAQIDKLAYAHTSFFTTEVAEELADVLIESAPQGMSHVYFVSGGSEAMEAALKMARQYFVEIGQPQRQHFVARRQSYHGNTLGALAVGGNESVSYTHLDVYKRQGYSTLTNQLGDAGDALVDQAGEAPGLCNCGTAGCPQCAPHGLVNTF